MCSDASATSRSRSTSSRQDLLHHRRERGRVARAEAQPDALAPGDDLPQPAGVGDEAGTARRHRLERHEPERLVQRRDHAEVGDRVERVQHRVVDPAEEVAVAREAELARLRFEVALGGPRAGDEEAHVAEPLDHARQRVEREVEALLVHQPPHQQHETLLRRRVARPQARQVGDGLEVAGIDAVGHDRHALLVDPEYLGDVAAHVVRARDHAVGGAHHPPLDAVDVALRVLVRPSPGGDRARSRARSRATGSRSAGRACAPPPPPASRGSGRGRRRASRRAPPPRRPCRRSWRRPSARRRRGRPSGTPARARGARSRRGGPPLPPGARRRGPARAPRRRSGRAPRRACGRAGRARPRRSAGTPTTGSGRGSARGRGAYFLTGGQPVPRCGR